MGQKRKRDAPVAVADNLSKLSLKPSTSTSFQIIAGSYDRVLHGLRVAIPSSVATTNTDDSTETGTSFTPLFLFTAHAASIRCLAVSPPSDGNSSSTTSKRILATSSPDTKINLYHLHTRTNLGTLAPPSASPTTSLVFPSKSTLISTDEAGYIHIFKTRDWSLLSSLHCPAPKPKPGQILSGGGVNSIAVHPSGKLALSVSRHEKSVRMWNLMTGRKAGVLVFPKSIPRLVTGVSGEGLKVVWRPGGKEGYAVMFERGVVLFGVDSVVHGSFTTTPVSKVHQIKFLEVPLGEGGEEQELCFLATEDGRVVVYLIPKSDESKPISEEKEKEKEKEDEEKSEDIKPILLATITPTTSDKIRIKDFDILPHPSTDQKSKYFLTTANSEGIIRVYSLDFARIQIEAAKKQKTGEKEAETEVVVDVKADGLAVMAGEYDTNRRITCLTTAEVEDSAAGIVKDGDEEEAEDDDSDSDSDSDSEEEDEEDEDANEDEDEEWGGIGEDEEMK
ncbi:uncharacterized protein DFL_008130 [Arthrobotrys flagrans]|uniref:Anaphase-promoting complex subunit 4 WD40 domain-containing protein n=1 Tax=Arthrobotrys flagrans TaxID=97331 RepID=A0A436ZMW5_ARTFL|nr:hypothetical protein DFL_008130 [Arthrobotrys flagrans]